MLAKKRIIYQTILQLVFTLPWTIAFGIGLRDVSDDDHVCSKKLRGWGKYAFIITLLHSVWAVLTAGLFYNGYKVYYARVEKTTYLSVLQVIQYLLALGSVVSFFGIFSALAQGEACQPLENISKFYVIVNFVLFMAAYVGFIIVSTCMKQHARYFDWSLEEKEGLRIDLVK